MVAGLTNIIDSVGEYAIGDELTYRGDTYTIIGFTRSGLVNLKAADGERRQCGWAECGIIQP